MPMTNNLNVVQNWDDEQDIELDFIDINDIPENLINTIVQEPVVQDWSILFDEPPLMLYDNNNNLIGELQELNTDIVDVDEDLLLPDMIPELVRQDAEEPLYTIYDENN